MYTNGFTCTAQPRGYTSVYICTCEVLERSPQNNLGKPSRASVAVQNKDIATDLILLGFSITLKLSCPRVALHMTSSHQ